MRCHALLLIAGTVLAQTPQQDEVSAQILNVKRVYVDRLTGGETAAQMRDKLIASLQSAKLFVITESQERADAFLRGAAEDLVFTDTHQMNDRVDAHGSVSAGGGSSSTRSTRRSSYASFSVGEDESSHIAERKHEASAAVRLVNKDGDVIWSTTKESLGAKFRSASADVADRITKQLLDDIERVRHPPAPAVKAPAPAK
jgi:hypothetical protein